MKAQQSPMIAKSILLMLTWKTNTQLNDETGNPCVCVFFLQFLIWNLTSLCHLKVVLLQCSAVVLKIKIICLSGGLLLRPCSQDWRLRGWLTKARRNAWHEDTSSFLPFLQICSLWGALEDQQAEVHTVSVWCKTLHSSFFLIFLFFNHLPWCSPLCIREYKPHLFFFSPSHPSSLSLLLGRWTGLRMMGACSPDLGVS